MKMLKSKYISIIVALLLLSVISYSIWSRYYSPTRIAVINFRDFQYAQMLDIVDRKVANIDRLQESELMNTDLSDYAVIFINGMGLRLEDQQADHIKSCIEKGARVYVHASTSNDNQFTNLTADQVEKVQSYLRNGGSKNLRQLFNYCRVIFDNKHTFTGKIMEAEVEPNNALFHFEKETFFTTVEAYQKYYEKNGYHKNKRPKVCLITSRSGSRSSGSFTINTLIQKLEDKNLNVYAVAGFDKRLEYIKEIEPDLVVYFPHGRLNIVGYTDEVIEWLKKKNIPLVCPIDVHEPYEEWLNSQNGLSGGILSQSIVMPELDGGIEPFTISAEFPDDRGLMVSMPIENRMNTFINRIDNWLKLKTMPNSEKKIAIFYFKGPGMNSLVASGMEVAESLLNVLNYLKDQGYQTGPLPDTAKALERRIQEEGPVLGPYAKGAFQDFLQNGQPELIKSEDYVSWVKENLMPELYQQVENTYGLAPGEYLSTVVDGQSYIALPRVQFGNIVILPQLMPGIGDDHNKLVHGAKQAPPHPYIAGYLWVRNGFKANALMHFGTHGSLEFTPWKQNALSDMDWADALIGDLPHPYVYTINNIGEAIVAKRRSYATMVSHITPPYMESELYGPLTELDDAIEGYAFAQNPALKMEYQKSIKEIIKELELDKDLGFENFEKSELTPEWVEKIHQYLSSIAMEKITRGLYVLGRQYDPAHARETAALMAIEPVVHSLARLDELKNNMHDDESKHVLAEFYRPKGYEIIDKILTGQSQWQSFISSEDITRLEDWDKSHNDRNPTALPQSNDQEKQPIKTELDSILAKACDPVYKAVLFQTANMESFSDNVTKWDLPSTLANIEILEFYGKHVNLHDKIEVAGGKDNEALASILRLGQAHIIRSLKIVRQHHQKLELEEKEYIEAVRNLRDALRDVAIYEKSLLESTKLELAAIDNALSGGYIAPSSGGDPLGNPQSVPTGRNLTAINMDKTPTQQSWKVGVRLAEATIQNKLEKTGKYPQKIAITLWGGELIRSEGTQIAMAFHFLGVEPVRNSRGIVHDVKLIPMSKLNRPRIDIVVQTSGQARDIAASRLFLINKAVKLASEANDSGEFENYVQQGTLAAEKIMKQNGLSPIDASNFSNARVFGGVNGNYGSNIMGMVESGDRWEDDSEITDQYLKNMGAMYTKDNWGHYQPGIFEAALQNTDTVVLNRSSNNWGPLSLDHVYEFMGSMNAVVRNLTGKEPDAMFSDLRNKYNPKMQDAKEAIWAESRTTLMNPKYISELQAEGASAAETFAEAFRNTYAWNVLKPEAIDNELWEKLYDVYVEDSLGLDMENYFKHKNPYALQEMTAVMLETIRKGYWEADKQIIENLSKLHVKLIAEHNAGCSGFVCDNAKLRKMIAQNVSPDMAKEYQKQIEQVRTAKATEQVEGIHLKKQDLTLEKIKQTIAKNKLTIILLSTIIIVFIIAVLAGFRRRYK